MPFFRGLPLGEGFRFEDCVPRELGVKAAAGTVAAGPLPLVDYFRLEDRFERLGPFGIAVRGRARSALLFSRKPIRQLQGTTIAVTEESSTTACLLRLLLEVRYELHPAAYDRVRGPSLGWVDEGVPPAPALARGEPGPAPALVLGGSGMPKAEGQRRTADDADALLLIGDEALRFQGANSRYPFEIDVGFEWWLWQHLPFVFAVWAIRRQATPAAKKTMELALARSLAVNLGRLASLAPEYAPTVGMPAQDIQMYLSSFIYRLSRPEEEGIQRFRALVDEHHLL